MCMLSLQSPATDYSINSISHRTYPLIYLIFLSSVTVLPIFYLLGYFFEVLVSVLFGSDSPPSFLNNYKSRIKYGAQSSLVLFTSFSIFAVFPSIISVFVLRHTLYEWGIMSPIALIYTLAAVVLFFLFITSLFIPVIFCRVGQTGTFYSVFDYKQFYIVFTDSNYYVELKPVVKSMTVIFLLHIVTFAFTLGLASVAFPITVFTSVLFFLYKYGRLYAKVTGMDVNVEEYISKEKSDEIISMISE